MVECLGLCHAHYRQHYRKRPLTPIRAKDMSGKKLPGITISKICEKALVATGQSPYRAARDVLEQWAVNQPMTTCSTSAFQAPMAKEGIPP